MYYRLDPASPSYIPFPSAPYHLQLRITDREGDRGLI